MRYRQLLKAVRDKNPTSILEIGTWNGQRASQMLALAPDARYYGFDLFEDATDETNIEEANVKQNWYLSKVADRLQGYDVHLYKGNTRETLKTFNSPVDFVWIDGGHSIETIRSDWENVKRVITLDAWVFFDDYYTDGIDTSVFGCNQIVKDLKHEVLPEKDEVVGGGFVSIVRAYP